VVTSAVVGVLTVEVVSRTVDVVVGPSDVVLVGAKVVEASAPEDGPLPGPTKRRNPTPATPANAPATSHLRLPINRHGIAVDRLTVGRRRIIGNLSAGLGPR